MQDPNVLPASIQSRVSRFKNGQPGNEPNINRAMIQGLPSTGEK